MNSDETLTRRPDTCGDSMPGHEAREERVEIVRRQTEPARSERQRAFGLESLLLLVLVAGCLVPAVILGAGVWAGASAGRGGAWIGAAIAAAALGICFAWAALWRDHKD